MVFSEIAIRVCFQKLDLNEIFDQMFTKTGLRQECFPWKSLRFLRFPDDFEKLTNLFKFA